MGRYCAQRRAGTVRPAAGLVPPVLGVDFTAVYYNNEGTPQIQINGLQFPPGAGGYAVLHKRNADPPPYTFVELPIEGGRFDTQAIYNDEEAVQVAWSDGLGNAITDYGAEFVVNLTD